jgi:hypothetical protein
VVYAKEYPLARPKKEIVLPGDDAPHQRSATASTAMFKLVGGMRGGGKTFWLAKQARDLAFFYPGNTGYIGRANLTDFEKSTLPMLLGLIPRELLITHNSQKHFIDIRSCDGVTPSRIWYGEMGDPGSLLSANLGFFCVDEAYQVPLETFVNLAGCLRGSLPNGQPLPYFGLLASNPAPGWLMDHFPVLQEEQELYEVYAEKNPDLDWEPCPSPAMKGKTIDPDYAYFPFSAADNVYNGPGYLDRIAKQYASLGPEFVSRFVYGVWDVSISGLVYTLREEHLWKSPHPSFSLHKPGNPVLLAGDPSNGAGIYACLACQVWRGRLLVIDEFYKKGGTDEDLRDWLAAKPWKGDIEDGIFDPAKPDSIKRLQSWGYYVRGLEKKKNITDQINAVKGKLDVDPVTGATQLAIDARRCPNLVAEFRRRVYRSANRRNPDMRVPEQPVKAWDHALNALEYLVYQLFPFSIDGAPRVAPPPPQPPAYMRLY